MQGTVRRRGRAMAATKGADDGYQAPVELDEEVRLDRVTERGSKGIGTGRRRRRSRRGSGGGGAGRGGTDRARRGAVRQRFTGGCGWYRSKANPDPFTEEANYSVHIPNPCNVFRLHCKQVTEIYPRNKHVLCFFRLYMCILHQGALCVYAPCFLGGTPTSIVCRRHRVRRRWRPCRRDATDAPVRKLTSWRVLPPQRRLRPSP